MSSEGLFIPSGITNRARSHPPTLARVPVRECDRAVSPKAGRPNLRGCGKLLGLFTGMLDEVENPYL